MQTALSEEVYLVGEARSGERKRWEGGTKGEGERRGGLTVCTPHGRRAEWRERGKWVDFPLRIGFYITAQGSTKGQDQNINTYHTAILI